jgi:hypothetical protein
LWQYGEVIQLGIQVVTSEHPFFVSIQEFQPMLTLTDFRSAHTFLQQVGWLLVFVPFGAYLAHTLFLRGGLNALTPIGFGFFLLGILRVRYFRWTPFHYSLWLGSFFWLCLKGLARPTRRHGFFPRLALMFLLVGIPIWLILGISFESDPTRGKEFVLPLVNGLAWLQRNSPDPGGYFDGTRPSYCVLGYWDKGNAIAFFAKRPPACNNLILGLDRMAAIYPATDDGEAFRACRRFDIRYWVVNPPLESFPQVFAHLRATTFHDGTISLTRAGIDWGAIKPITWEDTIHDHLFRYLGLGTSKRMGSRHFRLIYVDHEHVNTSGHPFMKIFEVVPGATLVGKALPHEKVCLSLPLVFPRMNNLERFYFQTAQANASGSFSFIVPYPSRHQAGGVRTTDYHLTVPERPEISPISVCVSESDVQSGQTILLPTLIK